MAFSYHNYEPTNNTTDTFSIPFTFTAQSEISVTVDGVAQTGLTFPSSSSVQLTSPVASGSLVQVRRTTSLASRAIDFASGSVLTEEDLDDSNIQVFHAAQEAIDTSNDSITLTPANRWDAGGSIINNVGTPTSNTDAATKAYADGISAAATAAATVAANAAVATATGDIIPDATKLAIHPIGSQYTLSDGTTTDYSAKHYQNAASTSATNAATSETNAGTSETNSQNWAVKTDGYAEGNLGYSSKAWAIGDTGGVSNTAGAGPAKDWAHGQGSFSKEIIIYWIKKNKSRGKNYIKNIDKFINSIRSKTIHTKKISFIKIPKKCMSLLIIDVQGFELEVLKGMNWKNSPDFIVYEDDLTIYNNKSNSIRKILNNKGYKYLGGKYDKIFSKKIGNMSSIFS